MNSQVAKVFRKWCGMRGIPYKTAKHMYEAMSFNERQNMLSEALNYVRLVNAGVIESSVPLLPTEKKVKEMVIKTMRSDLKISKNINTAKNEATQ